MFAFRRLSGFTLIELLLVAVILGVLAAVVVPQFSTNTDSTKIQASLSNLAAIRAAIDFYTVQHKGVYPGTAPNGSIDGTSTTFIAQMTGYTDETGAAVATRTSTSLGPYLREIPTELVTGSAKLTIDAKTTTLGSIPLGIEGGWRFVAKTGEFMVNHFAVEIQLSRLKNGSLPVLVVD